MKLSAALIFALLVLTGCGQKGPLYMPEGTSGQPEDPAREEMTQQPTEN
ncbi:LPS translocon maturation chaperone LptM [Halopseudomonas pelagia]|nr:lipoprotein [Halopseudomonas pelagia]